MKENRLLDDGTWIFREESFSVAYIAVTTRNIHRFCVNGSQCLLWFSDKINRSWDMFQFDRRESSDCSDSNTYWNDGSLSDIAKHDNPARFSISIINVLSKCDCMWCPLNSHFPLNFINSWVCKEFRSFVLHCSSRNGVEYLGHVLFNMITN